MKTGPVKPLLSLGLLLIGTACTAMEAEAASTTTIINSSLSPAVICSYAPSQSSMVSHLSAAAGGAAAAAALIAQAAGLTAVAHSSGAFIFTGAGGYISGSLGTAAALPAIVTVGVGVGGSVATLELICVDRNHPELVKKVRAAAAEFMNRSRNKAATTLERTAAGVRPFIAEFKVVAARARADGFEYANRASVQLGEAIHNKAK